MSRSRSMTSLAALVLVGSLASTVAALDEPGIVAGGAGTVEPGDALAAEAVGHLVISEVLPGGSSASDEFVELYNPAPQALPLEGLELIYVSASGATVTRKGAWAAGATSVPPGGHVLLANEAGIFAPIADLTYAGGLAGTGGSVAVRIQGAATALDAMGWGTAASTWLEGSPAPAPPAGQSLERQPGGAAGSGQDTNQNVVDFFVQPLPDPQNAGSPPVTVPTPAPSASPTPRLDTPAPTPSIGASDSPMPTPTPTLTPTLTPTPMPTPTSTPGPMTIAEARSLPDGTLATLEGVSLTDGAFADGGGYLADASGGIAVLVADGTFPRGQLVRVTGELDDRYHQRTLRVDAADAILLGPADEPTPQTLGTGMVGEASEGELVQVQAAVASSASFLAGGTAFDVDDGSGPVRLVVHDLTGIDVAGWIPGTRLTLRGVVGQRDSTGGGTAGYRVQPRDIADILVVEPPPAPTPVPTPTPSSGASPTPVPDPAVVSIAQARSAASGSRLRVEGIVILASGHFGDGTAVLQDASGAIVLRLGDEAGEVALGELLRVDGTRSTKSGMETLRVSTPPLRLGTGPQPAPARRTTGALGEADEARLVVVRGAVTTTPRRTSAENVVFDLDDGSGPVRVFVAAAVDISTAEIETGSWLEVVAVLGQETSGQQALRGYRLWPRVSSDLSILAAPGASPPAGDEATGQAGSGGSSPGGSRVGEVPEQPQAILPPGVVPPSLGSGRPARALPTASPDPAVAAATFPSKTGAPPAGLLLAVAAALLGGAAAVLGAQPGLVRRVAAAIRGRMSGASPCQAPEGAGTGDPGSPTPHLVPLRIVDPIDSNGDPRSGAASRSTERILPPT